MRSSMVVDEVGSAVAGLVAEDVTGWSDEQVRAGLTALLRVHHQVMAVIATVVGSFDARDLSTADGCRTARTWLTAFGRMSQGVASGWLSRARLQRQLPVLAAAALAGQVSVEHLRAVADLVDHVGIDAVRDFDDILATLARQGTPAQVRVACERIRAYVDPDGADPDPAASARRGLSVTRVGSLFALSGRLDGEGGTTLLAALDALMGPPAPDDHRTATQRRADALVELSRRALIGGDLPTVGGVRPQIGILLTPEDLLGPLPDPPTNPDHPDLAADPDSSFSDPDSSAHCEGAGHWSAGVDDLLGQAGVPPLPDRPSTNWKAHIPAEVAQRLACDSIVWRAVLDPATGLPLDVGRTHRIVPTWIRRALQTRDRGCRWTGCDVPAQWCDAHHVIPWYHGGQTTVDTCLLLCAFHHSLVHHELPPHQRWRLDIDQTTGQVHIHRPDGTPYELGPTTPHTPPTRRRTPPSEKARPNDAAPGP